MQSEAKEAQLLYHGKRLKIRYYGKENWHTTDKYKKEEKP
jgi:hypothetical protein